MTSCSQRQGFLVVVLTRYCWLSLADNAREFLLEQTWGVCIFQVARDQVNLEFLT